MTTATIDGSATSASGKGMHIGLWIAQIVVGLSFVAAGLLKATTPVEDLAAMMPWVNGAMGRLVRFIALAELAGGLGLILPAATRIRPWLTPLAAAGLTVIMVLAAATHLVRGEGGAVVPPLVLGGLTAFVAWGRARRAVIRAR